MLFQFRVSAVSVQRLTPWGEKRRAVTVYSTKFWTKACCFDSN